MINGDNETNGASVEGTMVARSAAKEARAGIVSAQKWTATIASDTSIYKTFSIEKEEGLEGRPSFWEEQLRRFDGPALVYPLFEEWGHILVSVATISIITEEFV